MSYLTLSRQYRPKAFDEILGQDNALTILKSFIQNYSLPHALIFCGSRGVGKTSMARILAKTINCDELLKSGKCKKYDSCSCKEIDENKSIDVIEIDAASNNGVDQIREIIDSSNYSSIRCKYKVFIIDEVHMLSKAAFNALLKTLEEPNKNTIFILATTEVEKIPLTVISRCQTINFKNIRKEDIAKYLEEISKNEEISIDNESIKMIADESRGSARDALGFLELLSNSLSKNIKIDNASIILGKTTKQILSKITENILKGDVNKVLNEYNNIYENGYDSKKFINSLMNYFRTMIYYKLGLEDTVDDIDILNNDETENLKQLELPILENLFDELIKLYDLSSKSDSIRFLIESHLIKLCLISNYLDFDLIIEKDEVPRDENKTNNMPKEVSDKKNIEKKKLKSNSSEFNSEIFLNNLEDSKNNNFKLLKESDFEIGDNTITIKSRNEILSQLLNEDSKKEEIKNLIQDIFQKDYNLIIKEPDKDSKESVNSDDFKFKEKKDKLLQSSSVKNLFDAFDCRIMDVEKEI